ncbi:MAG TPA: MtrB/PioB family outer membrane beta-barrel protein, partial [Usitatibacter sp.]|nr:MtrB/PioB family outer membrane beta-barrel protein [Usitatibacter sp.]
MNRKILSILVAGLFTAPGLASADDSPWITEGSATVGGIGTSKSGRDPSKIEEYQDLNSGVLSNILMRGRDSENWIDFYGENFGRDDQFITLRGGQYGTFKYNILTNWIPHNFLEQGLTPFQGSGTGTLTPNGAFPLPNPATWNTVNIGYERKDTKGYFEWQAASPWYTRIEGQQFTFQGTKPGSGAVGTSPGQGYMDFAIPVSYTTSNASAEVGYTAPGMHFAVNYLYSRFDNGQQTLTWTNPFFGNNTDTTFLPSDNNYQRLGANLTMRGLPAASTFAARYTWAKTTSGVDIPGTVLTSGSAASSGVYTPT